MAVGLPGRDGEAGRSGPWATVPQIQVGALRNGSAPSVGLSGHRWSSSPGAPLSGWPSPWVCLALTGTRTDVHCGRREPTPPLPASPPGVRRASASPPPPQVFHVAYVLVKFANSPRPDLWVLERSVDFGHTYQPWQFFACE